MPNRHRGEIEAELGGERRTFVLTLGALAELEVCVRSGRSARARGALRTGPHERAGRDPDSRCGIARGGQ